MEVSLVVEREGEEDTAASVVLPPDATVGGLTRGLLGEVDWDGAAVEDVCLRYDGNIVSDASTPAADLGIHDGDRICLALRPHVVARRRLEAQGLSTEDAALAALESAAHSEDRLAAHDQLSDLLASRLVPSVPLHALALSVITGRNQRDPEDNIRALERLLDAGMSADLDQGRYSRQSVLSHAAASGNTRAVEVLLERGAGCNGGASDGEQTPLMHAARCGHLGAVVALLAHGADPSLTGTECGTTPLMLASQEGTVDIVCALVEGGAEVAPQDALGRTAIDHAADAAAPRSAVAIVEVLAKRHPAGLLGDPLRYVTPLMVAIERGNEGLIDFLLAHPEIQGAVDAATGRDGYTALMLAAYHGFRVVVEKLLSLGADPTHTSELGDTALLLAAHNHHASVVDTLARRPEVDVNAARNDGMTPLLACLHEGGVHIPTLRALLMHGADPNPNMSRAVLPWMPPLMLAIVGDSPKAAVLLLSNGADGDAVDSRGRTAAVVARQCGTDLTEFIARGS